MSNTIDQKVVEMRFDNGQFEEGVKTSMGTLEKLKKSLNFSDLLGKLTHFGRSANTTALDISEIEKSTASLSNKFSALGIIGMTALQNITNSAINTGKRVAAALTIDPIKSGFQEYETQMNSVQTILANTQSKGSTLKDVNAALNELNTYSDKTIYNFTEMTRNIGTFTAAGVGLKTSVASIKGIANLAAVAGSNSQQASTAMYQLSQAIASGSVKLQDWNSVVNAGMGGELFQNALKRTARAHGEAVDAMIKKSGSFRESLKEGWLTTSVLTDTLEQLSGKYTEVNKKQLLNQGYSEKDAEAIIQLAHTALGAATNVKTFTQLIDTLNEAISSGWTQTWQTVIGDFEEAKKMWTDISLVLGSFVNDISNARNNLLQGWVDLGGRQDLIKTFINLFNALATVMGPIKEAWEEVFPAATAKNLKDLSAGLENLTHKMILTVSEQDALKTAFNGLFSVVKLGVKIFAGMAKVAWEILKAFAPLGNLALKSAGLLGSLISKMISFAQSTGIAGKALNFITDAISTASQKFSDFVEGLAKSKTAQTVISDLADAFHELEDSAKKFEFPSAAEFKNDVASAFESLKTGALPATLKLDGFTKAYNSLKASLLGSINDGSFSVNLSKKGVIGVVNTFITDFKDALSQVKLLGKSIPEAFKSVTDTIKTTVTNIFNYAKTIDWGRITDLIGLAVGIKIILSFVKVVTAFASAIGGLGQVLEASAKAISEYGKKMKSEAFESKAHGILEIAGAVGILAASVAVLSQIPTNQLLKGAAAVGIMMTSLIALSFALNKINASMVSDSLSIKDKIVSVFKGFAKAHEIAALAASAVMIAIAIRQLIKALEEIDNLNLKDADGSIGLLGGMLVTLTASLAILGHAVQGVGAGLFGAGALILSIVLALKQFAAVIKLYDELKIYKMGDALDQIAIALMMFTAAIAAIGWTCKASMGGLLGASAVMLSFIVVLKELTKLIVTYSTFDFEATGNAFLYMATALGIFVAAIVMLGTVTEASLGSMLGVSASMLAMVAVLYKMEDVLTYFSKVDPKKMKGSLWAVGILVTILTASTAVIGKFGKGAPLFGLSAAILAVTVALGVLSLLPAQKVIASGVALSAVMGTIAFAFAKAGKAGGSKGSIISMCAAIAVVATSLTVLSLMDTTKVLQAAGGLSLVIASLGLAFLGASKTKGSWSSMLAMCGVIASVAASLYALSNAPIDGVEAAAVAMAGVLGVLSITLAASKLATGAIPQLAILIGVIGSIGLVLGLLSALPVESVLGVGESLSAVLLSLSATMAVISFIPVSAAASGIAGLAVVVAGIAAVLAALGGLKQIPGFDWLISEGTTVLGEIGYAIGDFIGSIAGGLAAGLTSDLPEMGKNLSDFITNLEPFITGAKTIDSSVTSGMLTLAEAVLIITGTDVINGLTAWFTGGQSLNDFADQLVAFGPKFKEFAASIEGIDASTVQSAAAAATSIAEFAKAIPNEGGLIAKVTGENDLAKFGEELAAFGPSLKSYATSVSGLDAGVVTNSANAASAMSSLAKGLPNNGGLTGIFAGENDISTFGAQLVSFGTSLKSYAASVSGLDAGVVANSANAAQALSSLADNLPNNGGLESLFTGDNSISTFGTQLISFGQSLTGYSQSISSVDTAKMATITTEIGSLVTVIDSMANMNSGGASIFSTQLATLAQTGFSGFISAFDTASTTISGKYQTFFTSAANVAKGIIDGITSKKAELDTALRKMVSDSLSGISSMKASFVTSGENMANGFIQGINNRIEAAKAAAAALGTASHAALNGALDEHSPSKLTEQSGMFFSEGLENGIRGGSKGPAEAAKRFGLDVIAALNDALGVHSPSWKTYASGGYVDEGAKDGMKDGAEKVKTEAKNVGTGIVDTLGNALTKGMDTVTEDYGNSWQGLLGIQKNGLDQTNAQADDADAKDEARHQKKKARHEAKLSEEDAYWAQLLAIRQNGEDAQKYKDMSLGDFEKGILEQTIAIWKEYTDTLKQNTDALMNQQGLFSAVEQKQAVSADSLVKNLQDQINEYAQFNQVITSLNQRITDDGLKQAINKMGIDSLAELQALNGMTDQQLTAYAQLYDTKYALAANAASTQMETIKQETAQKLSDTYGGVEIDLDTFAQKFDLTMQSINGIVADSVTAAASAQENGKQIVAGLGLGMTNNVGAATTAAKQVITDTDNAMKTAAGIHSPSTLFNNDVGQYITQGIAMGITMPNVKLMIANSARTIINTALDVMRNSYGQFYNAGQNAGEGYKNGILSKVGEVASAAAEMANAAFAAAQRAIDSHSPSKKFIALGEFADEGFAIGFDNLSGQVANSSEAVGRRAIDSMKTVLARVSSVVTDSIDTEPTIRPVLDLSDITDKAGSLNAMLSKNTALSISSNMLDQSSASSGSKVSGSSGETVQKVYTFNQNNYSPKPLSRIEIYRNTNNQFAAFKEALDND